MLDQLKLKANLGLYYTFYRIVSGILRNRRLTKAPTHKPKRNNRRQTKNGKRRRAEEEKNNA